MAQSGEIFPAQFTETIDTWRMPFDPSEFQGWEVRLRNRYGSEMVVSVTGAPRTPREVANHLRATIVEPEDMRATQGGGLPVEWRIRSIYVKRNDGSLITVFDSSAEPAPPIIDPFSGSGGRHEANRPATTILQKPSAAALDMIHRFSDAQRMLIVAVARMTEPGQRFSWRDAGRYVGLKEHPSDDVQREMYKLKLAEHVKGGDGILLAEARVLAQFVENQVDDNRQRHVLPWWAFEEPDFPFDAPGSIFRKPEWDKVRLLCGIADAAAVRNRATADVKQLARFMMIDDVKRDQLLLELESEHLAQNHGNGDASITPRGSDLASTYTNARDDLHSKGFYFGGHPGPLNIYGAGRGAHVKREQEPETELPPPGGAVQNLHDNGEQRANPLETEPSKEMSRTADNPTSWSMLTQATKFYPPARFAIGLLAIGIVVVSIFQLSRGLNVTLVVVGVPVAVVLIVALIYLGKFAQTAEAGRNRMIRGVAHGFAVFCLVMTCAFLVALFTSAAFGVPAHLTHLLFPTAK